MHQLILLKSAERLGANPVGIREVPGWFLSRAFVVTVEKDGTQTEAFVRMKKNDAPGVYDDIDQRDTFFRSHLASVGNENHPKSLFVAEFETPDGASITIHAQEFRPAESGFDYEAAVSCDALSETQRAQIRDIASKLARLHLSPPNKRDATPESYERGVLELLINSELTYPTLAHFPTDHPFFGHVDAKYEYLSKMARAADRQIARKNDRACRRLHGDFWHSNVLFDQKGCYFIDFSRTPAGEAGTDVGWFLWNVALDAYLLEKNGAEETFDLFLETYVALTGDDAILANSVLPVFWIAIIRIFPPVYGNPEDGWKKAEKILKFVDSCYHRWELSISHA